MERRTIAAAAVMLIALTGCGGDANGDATGKPAVATPRETADADQPSFPVTIAHKFGATEVPQRPERVLALGFQEQDALLALGVTPIAVRYWFGDLRTRSSPGPRTPSATPNPRC